MSRLDVLAEGTLDGALSAPLSPLLPGALQKHVATKVELTLLLNPLTILDRRRYEHGPPLESFRNQHEQALVRFDQALEHADVAGVVLEGGHIYADQCVTKEHLDELAFTGLLYAHLSDRNVAVRNILFVDDFNAGHPHVLDVAAYVEKAKALGWPIDHIMYEAHMVPTAQAIVQHLVEQGKAVPEEHGIVLLNGSRKVHILRPKDGTPSCALLDAALSVVKYTLCSQYGIVNVLPRQWKDQQIHTRAIVRAYLGDGTFPYFNFLLRNENASFMAD